MYLIKRCLDQKNNVSLHVKYSKKYLGYQIDEKEKDEFSKVMASTVGNIKKFLSS